MAALGSRDTTQGYNFHGEKAASLMRALAAAQRSNARRVQCDRCGLSVADIDRHNALVHDDTEA